MKKIRDGIASLLHAPVYTPPPVPAAPPPPAAPVGFVGAGADCEIFSQTYEVAGNNEFLTSGGILGATHKRWSGIDVYVDVGPGTYRGIGVKLFAIVQGIRVLVYSTIVYRQPWLGGGDLTSRRVIAYRSPTPEQYEVEIDPLALLADPGPSPMRFTAVAANNLEPVTRGETSTAAWAGLDRNVINGGSAQAPHFSGNANATEFPGLRIRSLQAYCAQAAAAPDLYLLIGDKLPGVGAGWTEILWAIGMTPGQAFRSEIDFLGGYRFQMCPTFWVSTSPTVALGPTAAPSIAFSVMFE